MLFGTFSHTVDAKNRVFVPAKFREDLGDDFIIFRAPNEKKLLMMSMSEWDEYVAPFKELERDTAEKVFRFLVRDAVQTSPDSQGRVILSQGLLAYAGIEKAVAIVGCGTYAEIWPEAVFNAEDEDNIKASLVGIKFR